MSNLTTHQTLTSTKRRDKSPALSPSRAALDQCSRCNQFMYKLECFGPVMNKVYHKSCFRCTTCDMQLDLKNYRTNNTDLKDKNVYCVAHAPKHNSYQMVKPPNRLSNSSSAEHLISNSHTEIPIKITLSSDDSINLGWKYDENANYKANKPGWNEYLTKDSNIIVESTMNTNITKNEFKIPQPVLHEIEEKPHISNVSSIPNDPIIQLLVEKLEEISNDDEIKSKNEEKLYPKEDVIRPKEDEIRSKEDEIRPKVSEINKVFKDLHLPTIRIDHFDEKITINDEINEEIVKVFVPKPVKNDVKTHETPKEIDCIHGKNSNLGMIRISLDFDVNTNKLRVIIHEARNLINTDKKNASDPYARIYLLPDVKKQSKRKTRIIKDSLYPVWEEKFEYLIDTRDLKTKILYVNLKDDKGVFETQETTFMGEVVLKLSEIDLLKNGNFKKWFYLQNETHNIFQLYN